jgi:hypothetical protein
MTHMCKALCIFQAIFAAAQLTGFLIQRTVGLVQLRRSGRDDCLQLVLLSHGCTKSPVHQLDDCQ